MSPEEAAAKWVEENPDKVEAWLSLSRSEQRRSTTGAGPTRTTG